MSDLNIAYDAQQSCYYAYKDFVLGPKESVVIEIELNDIWRIKDEDIEAASSEAANLYQALKGTDFIDRGKFLQQSVLEKVNKLKESQKVKSPNPQLHIAQYRTNLELMNDIKNDLKAMKDLADRTMPGAFRKALKVITAIVVFLGILSAGLCVLWFFSSRKALDIGKEKQKSEESKDEDKDEFKVNIPEEKSKEIGTNKDE
jgi:hypothetical protein